MDRNLYYGDDLTFSDGVALRKESVDRNIIATRTPIGCVVALRKESVDRNINCNSNFFQKKQSLSARRAWIEICLKPLIALFDLSLSARRAWIEMPVSVFTDYAAWSLSARRAWIEMSICECWTALNHRRSPQGERG